MPATIRVFWPLELRKEAPDHSTKLLLYGFARPSGSRGVASALVVVGVLDPDALQLQAQLCNFKEAPFVSVGEQLAVLGEWQLVEEEQTQGLQEQQQQLQQQQQQQQVRPIRQRQKQHEKQEDAPETGRVGVDTQQQPGSGTKQDACPWITAAGLGACARTFRPMRCPGSASLRSSCKLVPVPRLHVAWPGHEAAELQVFLYTMPALGRSHAPVLAAEAASQATAAPNGPQPPAASSWMGDSPGPTSLEWACHCINRAAVVRWCIANPGRQLPLTVRLAWFSMTHQDRARIATLSPSPLAGTNTLRYVRRTWARISPLLSRRGAALPRPRPCASAAGAAVARQRLVDCLASELLQRASGAVAAAALLRFGSDVWEGGGALGRWIYGEALWPNIAWLMSAKPGGVKLHAELTYLLGSVTGHLLDWSELVYQAAWPALSGAIVWILVVAGALLGLCGALAAASDLIWWILLPLEACCVAMAALCRLHLACMRTMWRLMRGKADRGAAIAAAARLRRSRDGAGPGTASAGAGGGGGGVARGAGAALWGNPMGGDQEVTAEHVIVGVLLFTPLLALLPTTAAWCVFACVVRAALVGARGALLGAMAMAARNPVCAVTRRVLRPGAYPGDLAIEVLLPGDQDHRGGHPSQPSRGHQHQSQQQQRRQTPEQQQQQQQEQQQQQQQQQEQLQQQHQKQLQRCFLLGYRPMSLAQVLSAAWGTSSHLAAGPDPQGAAGMARLLWALFTGRWTAA